MPFDGLQSPSYGQWIDTQRLFHEAAKITRVTAEFSASLFPYFSHLTVGQRLTAAAAEVLEHFTVSHGKPAWDISNTQVNGQTIPICEKAILEMPFCDLLHFEKSGLQKAQPRLLVFAPLSGHYATLLRGTVKGLLPYYDVYITDWKNARDVPAEAGDFRLRDYIDYAIDFIDTLNADGQLHVKAICQPCPPVLAAVALISQRNDRNHPPPRSLILSAGPVDARANPTQVTRLAAEKPLSFFEGLTQAVPTGFAGHGRQVYPGFIQLFSFLAMNPARHGEKMYEQFWNLVHRDNTAVEKHNKFYGEYLAVLDMPKGYFVDTIRYGFQEHALASGTLDHRGTRVGLSKITIPLMAIEGSNDDISAPGQTVAALNLCPNIPQQLSAHLLVPGVGHYGVFSGAKYQTEVVDAITRFTARVDANLNLQHGPMDHRRRALKVYAA